MEFLAMYQPIITTLVTDSLSESLESITDTLSIIAMNTNPQKVMNVDVEVGNFGIGVISLLAGILGVIFGWLAYRFSKKTAENVVRMTAENQIALFNDMIRHLYRNLVCSLAIGQIQENCQEHCCYPSEEHLLKLKMLPEDTIHLDKYNDNKHIYCIMHELKLLLRNYDTEIDVCLMHYKDRSFSSENIKNDLSVLTFKPLYLISRIAEIEHDLYKNENDKKNSYIKKLLSYIGINKESDVIPDQFSDAASVMICEHLSKLMENIQNVNKWGMNYKFTDYCNADTPPANGCSKGFKVFIGQIAKSHSGEIILHPDQLTLPENENMVQTKKERLRSEDIFCPLRKNKVFADYISKMEQKDILFSSLLPEVLSIDVAIEKTKIRFFKFN